MKSPDAYTLIRTSDGESTVEIPDHNRGGVEEWITVDGCQVWIPAGRSSIMLDN